jgi:hypothetical protein
MNEKRITFKQFVGESELTELAADMFLRKKFGVGKLETKQILAWLQGEIDYTDMGSDIWEHIRDSYAGEIPYSVDKDGDPMFTDEWIHEKLMAEMRRKGIDVDNI